ncbi:porin [Halarcobacter sp.]|uniref:porin n=1 Tax=Halarcobacter sp. TaxID=2321133 RepID=UPI0029F5AC46|nr:porin [Halarcobacter sp.]
MTKFTKMSLIAALALAGTTASAQPLTEAIKNVDVSGTVAYRYNDYEDQAKGSKAASPASDSATNNYKIAVNLKSKVNDDITANTRFIIGSGFGNDAIGLGTSNDGDGQVNVTLSEVNFTYTGVQGLSVTVGKQGIATPWTVARDAMGDEQTGTGIVAAYTFGPATLVGAYFNQTNFDQSELGAYSENDIYVIGAMASFAGVSADAFYADLDDVFDAYTVGLSGSFDLGAVKLSPFARYSSLDLEGTTLDNALWQLGLSADIGMFSGFVAYGESDDEGGLVYIDSGATTNMDYHWRVTADGSADTEYLYVHATADVTDKLSLGVYYSEADYKTASDVDEVYAQIGYKMSKNFSTYVRFGELNVDNSEEDGNMGRVHVQYSF